MSRIPTPFIGGADSPHQDRTAKDQFAPPYVPGADEAAAEDAAAADAGLETAEETLEPVSADVSAAEKPPVEVESLEPDAPEFEVPVAVEWVDAEPETAPGEEEALEFVEFEELQPSEEVLEFLEFEEPQPGAEAAPEVTSPPAREVAPAAEAESGLPDFLLGADGGGPELPSAQSEQALVPGESPEALAEEAERLLQGEQGERIRALMADLGRYGADIAVPRAFAAGYLAAKRREEG